MNETARKDKNSLFFNIDDPMTDNQDNGSTLRVHEPGVWQGVNSVRKQQKTEGVQPSVFDSCLQMTWIGSRPVPCLLGCHLDAARAQGLSLGDGQCQLNQAGEVSALNRLATGCSTGVRGISSSSTARTPGMPCTMSKAVLRAAAGKTPTIVMRPR